jgi:hypothetical protein
MAITAYQYLKKLSKCCWGPKNHIKGCRISRPLCRWMRAKTDKYKVCHCGAYHFPHRKGSGACGNHDLMNKIVWGTQEEYEYSKTNNLG